MEPLIILPKDAKIRRFGRAFCGLFFLSYCGYILLDQTTADQCPVLSVLTLSGILLALVLFLANTLWVSGKALIKIDEEVIESNIKGNKLKLEWIKVSKVSISESDIIFHINGERKEKPLSLSDLAYKDVAPVKNRITWLCEHKNIVCRK